MTGLELADRFRGDLPDKEINLCTDRDLEQKEWQGRAHAVIGKDPVGLALLLE